MLMDLRRKTCPDKLPDDTCREPGYLRREKRDVPERETQRSKRVIVARVLLTMMKRTRRAI